MTTNNAMHQWFIYLFDQRKDEQGYVKCFECGKKMHEDTWKHLSTCYSHILSKKTFPKYKGEEFNIVIVHSDCHQLYTISPSKAAHQFAKYEELLEKHYNNEL
jgi:hypothetical protein